MRTVRKVVRIDESKCDGCGLCESACVEGAIRVIDGKARLVGDSLCDGLGACLGECPTGALTIEEREADGFVEPPAPHGHAHPQGHACPGSAVRSVRPVGAPSPAAVSGAQAATSLGHWPVQLMLVPPHAPFLSGADVLVCADCVPFAVADFHDRWLAGRAVLVGCPKLDDLDFYREKLRQVVALARPASFTVLRMEVPCCGGIARAVVAARDAEAPGLPVTLCTVGIGGEIRTESV